MNSLEFARQHTEQFIARRRDLHKHPEPGWLEYRTAAFAATVLTELGYDIKAGAEVLDLDARMGLPSEAVMKAAMERAIAEGADPKWVDIFGYGKTALVATMKFSDDGPTVAFRSDIDSNDVQESDSPEHMPAREGFSSIHDKAMHACGHDVHLTMILGLAEYLATNKDKLQGTVKLIIQPAEEGVRGAAAMEAAGVVDDVDIFFGTHIGIDKNLAGCLACSDPGFLATSKIDASFQGYSAHAGASPEQAKNAMLAACTAVINLQAIARHSKGISRVNVGTLEAGTGRNVTPDVASLKLEIRGETTEINDYMEQRCHTILEAAAAMHDCTVNITKASSAPVVMNSDTLATEVQELANELGIFKRVDFSYSGGGSEDCAYFTRRVIERGGQATYMILGSDIKAPHHNPLFDIDEKDMIHGVALMGVLAEKYLKSK